MTHIKFKPYHAQTGKVLDQEQIERLLSGLNLAGVFPQTYNGEVFSYYIYDPDSYPKVRHVLEQFHIKFLSLYANSY